MLCFVITLGVIVAVVELATLVLKLHTGFAVKIDSGIALVALKPSALSTRIPVQVFARFLVLSVSRITVHELADERSLLTDRAKRSEVATVDTRVKDVGHDWFTRHSACDIQPRSK
jgi:hypothetical protein